MNTQFMGFEEYKATIPTRTTGAMISDRGGKATGYALYNLEPRGKLFIVRAQKFTREWSLARQQGNDPDRQRLSRKEADQHASFRKRRRHHSHSHQANVAGSGIEWISDDELIEVTPEISESVVAFLIHTTRSSRERVGSKGPHGLFLNVNGAPEGQLALLWLGGFEDL